MASQDNQGYGKKESNRYLTKKCPHCYVYLPLHAKVCSACKAKVGEVDKLGFAEKPFDYMGYLVAIVSVVGFCFFMWWGFFRE